MRPVYIYLIIVLLTTKVFSQSFNRRNTNKTIPYRGNYQRLTTGPYSESSFEIRNGTLWAWGANGDWQLGDGTNIFRTSPVQIGTSNNWYAVSSSKSHTLGLRTDGTLWAWGYNGAGGLGDGTDIDKTSPIRIGNDSNWISVNAGFLFSVGLKADGTLWAWGYNDAGRLGNGNTNNSLIPIQIGIEDNWTNISVGLNHTLALKSDGTLWSWGDNTYGQLGDGTTTTSMVPIQIGNSNNWTSISVGVAHSMALKADGTLWTWGNNSNLELGDGTTNSSASPIQITNANNWVSISAGSSHSLALRTDGTLWAWGYNFTGQVGDGSNISKSTPTQIGTSNNWVGISGGMIHSLALQSDGTMWSWGYNGEGSLGDGTTIGKKTPVKIGVSSNDMLVIVSGIFHNMALKSDGTLWAWGLNDYGQLGDGTYLMKNSPIQVSNDHDWIGVAVGSQSSYAIKSNGTLWAWGRNNNGQLGDGTNSDKALPIQIGTSNNWVYVYSSMGSSSFGIKSDGTLWAWGDNSLGQLGDGTQIMKLIPIQIGTSNNWIQVLAGNGHTIANKSDGTIWSWGDNSFGQLGDGTTIAKLVPTQIGSSNNWLSVSSLGSSHTLALKSNGTLWAWGKNANYQLGDGTNVNRKSPIQIGTNTNWITVSTGDAHSLALRSNGTLWSWGYNGLGQIGDGSNVNKILASKIGIDNTWLKIFAGFNYSIAIKSNRQQYCSTGENSFGQLGDGTNTNKNVYSCYTKISIPPPSVSGFTPSSGSIGTLIKVSGISLTNLTSAGLGSQNALIVSKTDSNVVIMVMPNNLSGIVWLKIGTDTIKTLNGFTITSTPYTNIQQGNKLIGNANVGASMQGYAVSISADGNTAIIGGSNDNNGIGAAWIYTRINGSWIQQGNKLVGSGIIGEGQLGSAVAINADGNTAVVGAINDSFGTGSAFIFNRIGGTWTQQGSKLVGNGITGTLNQMGCSVGISADGNTVIVGAYGDNNNTGGSYVFVRNNNVWSQQGSKLFGLGAIGNAKQGFSVAISSDGNTAICGGVSDNNDIGASWIFVRNAGVWAQQGNKLVGSGTTGIWASQGYSLSISADGSIAAIGGISDNGGMGATWIFSRIGTTWTQMGSKLVGTGSFALAQQGASVSLSADGKTLLVGAFGDESNRGSVWVFTRNANTWQQKGLKISLNGLSGDTSFVGRSLSISADANTAIVGAYGDSSFMGASCIIVSPDPTISNNVIFGNQNICFGSSPSNFVGSNPSGGNGSFNYFWLKSNISENTGFTAIPLSNTKDFSSTSLNQKTWFKRCVISGTSIDTSVAILV